MKLTDVLGGGLKVLQAEGGCSTCPRARKDFVPATLPDTDLIIVGEAPGAQEVEKGEGFVGQSGQLLRNTLKEYGIEDFALTNTIHCRPPDNRNPHKKEIKACLNQYVIDEIKRYSTVVLVGKVPADTFFPDASYAGLRGHVAWHADFPGTRFYTIYHPAYMLRRRDKMPEFEKQIARLSRILEEDPFQPAWNLIRGDSPKSLDALDAMLARDTFAFDIETTGLESWHPDQEVTAFAVCASRKEAVFFHKNDPYFQKGLERVGEAVQDPTKTVLAHNAGFDLEWIERDLGITTQARIADTQALYYLIYMGEDFRKARMQSLKRLTNQELDGYRYLITSPHLCNDVPLLAKYGSEDVIRTYQVFRKGFPQLNRRQVDLFFRISSPSSLALRRLQTNGLYIDTEHADILAESLTKKIDAEIKAWQEEDPEFDPEEHGSGDGFLRYVYEIRGFPVINRTEKDKKPASDKDTIKELIRDEGAKVLKHHLEVQTLEKQMSTFVKPYQSGKVLDPYTGRVHPSYLNCFTRTGRASSRKPNCYDADTEILTKRGWVSFPELQNNDEVAQFDPDNSTVEFGVPDRVIRQEYSGPMLHFANQQIELLVTPNHRMLVESRRTGERKVWKAREWRWDYKHLHAGQAKGGDSPLTASQVRVLVALQADGSYHRDGGITFGFRKACKYERIKELLTRVSVPYNEHNYANGDFGLHIRKEDQAKKEWLNTLGPEKVFGEWVLDLSRKSLDAFVEEIWYWDAALKRKNHYSSSVRVNADWVQAALALSNTRARMRPYENGHADTNWQVDIKRAVHSYTTHLEPKEIHYEGMVYCVTVPTGFVVVRRKSADGRVKVSVSGNSQNIPRDRKVRSLFAAPEGKVFMQSDLSQIELRIAMCLSGDPVGIGAYLEEGDLHAKTAKKLAHDAGRDEWTKEDRTNAKIMNFSLIYGGDEGTVKRYAYSTFGINYSWRDAEKFHKTFFDTYAELHPWHQEVIDNMRANRGYTETVMGHPRFLEGWDAPEKGKREHYERVAINTTCQSPAGYMTLLILYLVQQKIKERGLDKEGVLTTGSVHDSILYELPPNKVVTMVELVEEAVDEVYEWISDWFIVPLVMDYEIGESWGQLNDVNKDILLSA